MSFAIGLRVAVAGLWYTESLGDSLLDISRSRHGDSKPGNRAILSHSIASHPWGSLSPFLVRYGSRGKTSITQY